MGGDYGIAYQDGMVCAVGVPCLEGKDWLRRSPEYVMWFMKIQHLPGQISHHTSGHQSIIRNRGHGQI